MNCTASQLVDTTDNWRCSFYMTGNKKGMSPVPDRTHATNFLDSDDAPVFFHFTLTAAPPSPSAFLQILCMHLQSAWLMSYRPLLFSAH